MKSGSPVPTTKEAHIMTKISIIGLGSMARALGIRAVGCVREGA